MYPIQNITSDPSQERIIVLPDGTFFDFTMYYSDQQYGWFITNMTYGSFTLNGLRITNNPNMLRQFKNQIAFGLACFTDGNREPTQIQDFSSGAASLYMLDSSEVQQYEEFLIGL
jgi:hypothetical protein